MIPLFTSIPPRAVRTASNGEDISAEYASVCARSWRAAGFDPATVNSRGEAVAEVVREENIKLIQVDRDARSEYGKPLVFFTDLLEAACAGYQGPIAITNADIMLDVPKEVYRELENLRAGESFIAKRQDVDRMDSRAGTEYAHGYDLFVFHTADLRKFWMKGFVFGMPWWDHALPIDMYLRKLEALPSRDPVAFHLSHSERWDAERWVTLGRHFLKALRCRLDVEGCADKPAMKYASDLSGALRGPEVGTLGRLKKPLRALVKSCRLQDEMEALTRVANVNVGWLDGIRTGASGRRLVAPERSPSVLFYRQQNRLV